MVVVAKWLRRKTVDFVFEGSNPFYRPRKKSCLRSGLVAQLVESEAFNFNAASSILAQLIMPLHDVVYDRETFRPRK